MQGRCQASLNGGAEATDAVVEGGFGDGGEAEEETGARIGGLGIGWGRAVAGGEGGDGDAAGSGGLDDGGFVGARRKAEGSVETGGIAADSAARRQVALHGGDEGGTASAVERARAPQVAGEVAGGDEVGKYLLVERGGLAVGQPLGRDKRGNERGRGDDPADAQGREEDSGATTDVDDAAALVQPLQCRQRRAGVAELAGVVVFDDQGLVAGGPVDQLEPPPERERDTGGVLVRGRDVNQARRTGGGQRRQRGVKEAMLVHRQRLDAGTGGGEDGTRGRIARLLDSGNVARIETDAGEEIERLLGAGGDDDLVGGTAQAARADEETGQRLPQRPVAGRVAILPQLVGGGRAAPAAGEQPTPARVRKGLPVGHAGTEVEAWAPTDCRHLRRRQGGG